jgi:hypothetical protein
MVIKPVNVDYQNMIKRQIFAIIKKNGRKRKQSAM